MISMIQFLDVEFNFQRCNFNDLYNIVGDYANDIKIDATKIIFTLKIENKIVIIKSYSIETDILFDKFDYIEWYKMHSNAHQSTYNAIEQGIKDKVVGNFKFERFSNITKEDRKCICDIDTLTLKGCICRKEI